MNFDPLSAWTCIQLLINSSSKNWWASVYAWCEEHSLEKTLMLGKIEGRRGWQRMRCLDSIPGTWIWANSGRQWRTEDPGMLQSMGSQRVGHDLAAEQHQPTLCSLNLSLAPPPIHSFISLLHTLFFLALFLCVCCLCSYLVHYSLWKESCFGPNFWSICRLHRCWVLLTAPVFFPYSPSPSPSLEEVLWHRLSSPESWRLFI